MSKLTAEIARAILPRANLDVGSPLTLAAVEWRLVLGFGVFRHYLMERFLEEPQIKLSVLSDCPKIISSILSKYSIKYRPPAKNMPW